MILALELAGAFVAGAVSVLGIVGVVVRRFMRKMLGDVSAGAARAAFKTRA